MSSRRDSRGYIPERQNDTLLEFENFKRKYLLVNKHITKLNSTLSVRVEELNAQVSSLCVENMRLRASEISLASQLRRERKKAQQVVDETEDAVSALMQQLTGLRSMFDIRPNADSSSPILKRKPQSSPVQPPREATRLVKPPADAITQIRESDEEDTDDDDGTPTRLVTTRRPASSRLPLPKPALSSATSPPPPESSAIPHINLATGATKRKARRETPLSTIGRVPEPERSPSSFIQSTTTRLWRRDSNELEDEDRANLQLGVGANVVPIDAPDPKSNTDRNIERMVSVKAVHLEDGTRKINRKGKAKDLLNDRERETETLSNSEWESSESAREKDKRRFGIKDVTNSPRKPVTEFAEETSSQAISSATITTPLPSSVPVFNTLTPRPNTPLPGIASTPVTERGSDGGEGLAGRERRTRKSVNYAEPKLNTKMRKPGPPPETAARRRVSASTSARRRKSNPMQNPGYGSDDEGDADIEGSGTRWTEGRRKTVHNAVSPSRPRTAEHETTDGYGMLGSDGRRHSIAV